MIRGVGRFQLADCLADWATSGEYTRRGHRLGELAAQLAAAQQSDLARGASALERAAAALTAAVESGHVRGRDLRGFHELALTFLDIRAALVGDEAWLRRRRSGKRRLGALGVARPALLEDVTG